MSTTFDPYSQWLGIAEGPRPPDFYSLLGLLPTERDSAAIARAADMQLARLRQVRPGEWAAVWSRLIDEITEAKRCLTDPHSKAVYDAAIAARVASLQPSVPLAQAVGNGTIPVAMAATAPPLGVAVESSGGQGMRVPFPVGYSQPATTVSGNGAADPPPLPVAAALPAWPGAGVAAAPSGPAAAVADLAINWPGRQSVRNGMTAPVSVPLPQAVAEVGGSAAPGASQAVSVLPQAIPTAAALGTAIPQPTPPLPSSMPGLPAGINAGNAVNSGNTAGAGGVAKQAVSRPARSSGGLFAVFRWSVVGVLLATLGVLSVMLYNKLQDEAARGDPDGKKTEVARSENGNSRYDNGTKGGEPTETDLRTTNKKGSTPSPLPNGSKRDNSPPAKALPVSAPTEEPIKPNGAAGGASQSGSKNNRPDDPPPAPTPSDEGRQNGAPPAGDDPQKRTAFRKALGEARIAMAEREYADAKKALATAASLAQSADDRRELQRLEQLEAHLDGFWKSIRGVMPKLDGTEMPIGNTFISIVEADEHHVLVKAAGQMRRYGVGTPDMPIKLITAIAEQRFKSDPTWNALYGTFHAMDRDGDRAKARQLWEQAGKLGADLLAELDVPRQSAISPGGNVSGGSGGARPNGDSPPAAADFASTIAELKQQAEAAKALAQHSEVARKALAECQRACAAKRWDDALMLAQIAQGAARESKSPALLRQAYAAVQQIEAVRKDR